MTTSECESGQWRVQTETAHLFFKSFYVVNLISGLLDFTDIMDSFSHLWFVWHSGLPFLSPQFLSSCFCFSLKPFPTSYCSFQPSLHPSLSSLLSSCAPSLFPLSPSIPNATYQMEGDSMQLWVLSSRQHLSEKLSHTHTCIQTEGRISTNLSLSSVAYIIVLRWSYAVWLAYMMQSGIKVFAARKIMYHNVTTR